MGTHADTLRRMDDRLQQLAGGFTQYVTAFNRANLFTGPSLYFHLKSLALLRSCSSATMAVENEQFLESLYATLAAWGMHRMGPGGAKLVEFAQFKDSFSAKSAVIQELEPLRIWEIEPRDVLDVARRLWEVISGLRVGMGRTKIVAGSKALHHVLPDLLPPIDREYTLRFFYHHTTLNQGAERAFKEIFPRFHWLATRCQKVIRNLLGIGMNTNPTKVMDNAIVGYVLTHIKD